MLRVQWSMAPSGGSGAGGSGGKQGKSGGGKKKGAGGAESATPSLCDCASCGASEGSIPGIKKHSACGRCKMTYYCSPKCQKGQIVYPFPLLNPPLIAKTLAFCFFVCLEDVTRIL